MQYESVNEENLDFQVPFDEYLEFCIFLTLVAAKKTMSWFCSLIDCIFIEESELERKSSTFCHIQVATEQGLQEFTFKQLHSATGSFGKSNVIGHGAFGLVYRGVLQDGRKVAVKLMDQAGKQGEEEFQVEVWFLFPLLFLVGIIMLRFVIGWYTLNRWNYSVGCILRIYYH